MPWWKPLGRVKPTEVVNVLKFKGYISCFPKGGLIDNQFFSILYGRFLKWLNPLKVDVKVWAFFHGCCGWFLRLQPNFLCGGICRTHKQDNGSSISRFNIAMSAGQFSLLNGAQTWRFQIWEFYRLMVYFGRDII